MKRIFIRVMVLVIFFSMLLSIRIDVLAMPVTSSPEGQVLTVLSEGGQWVQYGSKWKC